MRPVLPVPIWLAAIGYFLLFGVLIALAVLVGAIFAVVVVAVILTYLIGLLIHIYRARKNNVP